MRKLTLPANFDETHIVAITTGQTGDSINKISWSKKMINILISSGLFEVNYEEFPVQMRLENKRANFLSFFKIDGVLYAVDAWDSHDPSMETRILWKEHEFYKNTKMLFKIQRFNKMHDDWKKFEDETGIKTSNWTMFPSNQFPLGSFNWLDNPNKKYYGVVSGKRRKEWINYYRNDSDFFVPPEISKNECNKQVSCDRVSFDDFFNVLKDCLWGVSLHGKKYKRLDCKNRREVEYTSVGLPLAMNYQPEYPFPFVAGEHYYYFENMEDLKTIKNIDPMPYHKKSLEVYDKYFSPVGASSLLLELIDKG